MKIFQNAFEAGKEHPGAVVAIGKFDGMHRGHQKLIRAALRRAKALKTGCLVLTFDPSPEEFLRLYSYRPILSLAQRLERLFKLGVDGVVLLPFNNNLACQSPEAFAKDILALQLKPVEVFVGHDFCFGKDRIGRASTLESLGRGLGFLVRAVPLALEGGDKISASRIRRLLEQGDAAAAEKLLGWPLGDVRGAKK